MSITIKIGDVFIQSASTIAGPKEKEGPLGDEFDACYQSIYSRQKTYEDGEIEMCKTAIDLCLKKSRLRKSEIQLALGGDLNNQIACSNYIAKDLPLAFIGVYGACSNATLTLALASSFVHSDYCHNALCYTSSNYGVAERQFRYPTEYGNVKKETATITVSGAGAAIIGKKETKVLIDSVTIGEVKDVKWDNINDMGTPMALAAYETIYAHLKNTKRKIRDYDIILTGDLSAVGSKVLEDLFASKNIIFFNHQDAGKMIYDREQQKMFAGGSGCGCLALVTYSLILKKLERSEYKRVLIVGTGALHSQTYVSQKKTIPVIAHAVELVRYDK